MLYLLERKCVINVNFVAIAKRDGLSGEMATKYSAAKEYILGVFPSTEYKEYSDERVRLLNLDRVKKTWNASSYYEDEGQVVGFSQPPISVRDMVSSELYWRKTLPTISSKDFVALLPNHFGIHIRKGAEVIIWADAMGIGRCYWVETDDFFAASNHIGILAFFLDSPLKVDEAAVGRYAGAGWFMEDDSPYIGIHRLRESTMVVIDQKSGVKFQEYADQSNFFGARDVKPNFDRVVDEFRVVSSNLGALALGTPNVYLSGGRDSRMTAAAWLSAGNSARVTTMGHLPMEAEIATELMAIFQKDAPNDNVRHVVTVPQPRDIKQPISKRIEMAFLQWDGDAAPANLKRDVTIPTGRSMINIGGVGGEIMHGYYYLRPGMIERVQSMKNPLDHAKRSFSYGMLSQKSISSLDEAFNRASVRIGAYELSKTSALDYFYLNEKLRRWGNQALGSTSAIMLSSPEYVRACFDMGPQDKVDKVFPAEIVKRTIPAWNNVEIYKAAKEDSKRLMRGGVSMYETDPNGFIDAVSNGTHWGEYFNNERFEQFIGLVSGPEALPIHESWLNRAIWIEAIYENAERLRRTIEEGV